MSAVIKDVMKDVNEEHKKKYGHKRDQCLDCYTCLKCYKDKISKTTLLKIVLPTHLCSRLGDKKMKYQRYGKENRE